MGKGRVSAFSTDPGVEMHTHTHIYLQGKGTGGLTCPSKCDFSSSSLPLNLAACLCFSSSPLLVKQ